MIPDLTTAEIARFHGKFSLDGCGVRWIGGDLNNHGYGRFSIYRSGERVRILAHRLAYKLATGDDPGTAVVRHKCDSPPCCTPDCLIAGTQADNIRDALARGRMNISGLQAFSSQRDAAVADRLASGMKQCSRCWLFKPFADFFQARDNADGRAYWCKRCVIDHQRDYRRGLSERERRCLKREAA
jgi:hypothetical protein